MLIIVGIISPTMINAEESDNAALNVRHYHNRSLAASCAACHGTNGNAVGNGITLAEMNNKYFITQMLAFKSGKRVATVMHHHAKGLNDQEVSDLAEYFFAQPSHHTTVLQSQKLLP